MAIADDFSINLAGDIRYTGTTNNYTVLELHRFLQDLADQAQASGNDLIDITSDNPSERFTNQIITLNSPYNIDDDAAEHLYGGSIRQNNGDTLYSGLQVVGAVNTPATQIMIKQDGGDYQFTPTPATPFWGTQASPYNGGGNVLLRILVKTRQNGADIDGKRVRVQARHYAGTVGDTYDYFDVRLGDGEGVGAISTTPDPQNDTNQATVTAYTDVLNSGGTANAPTGGYQTIDLNNGNGAQPYYSQWTYGTQPDGLKALWEYTKDLSRTGTSKTIDTLDGSDFLGITHEINYDGQTVNFQEREDIVWGTNITYDNLVSGPFTPGNYVTIGSSGASGRVMYDDGIDTLIVALEDTTITLLDNDVITEYPGPGAGATTTTANINVTIVDNDKEGGHGIILAMNDGGTTGTIWIQLLSGVVPVDNLPLLGSSTNGDGLVNGTPVARTVPKIFTGSYTGSYIGAFGIGIESIDLTATDTITDLLGATQTPPNNVTFSITGLVSGEDRVLVGPRLAGALDKQQLTLNTTLNGATETAVVVTTAIPTDTPTSGDIRVENDNGIFVEQPYTSYVGSIFTIPSTDYSVVNATQPRDVFISYIDLLATDATESFTSVYLADRDLTVRVRDGGTTPIKPFESNAGVLTNTGGTIAAIRTSDA